MSMVAIDGVVRGRGAVKVMAMLFASLAGLSATLQGCDGGVAAAVADRRDPVGAVALALELPTGSTIETVSYSLTRLGDPISSGQIDVSHADTRASVDLGGVPAGSDYRLDMSASSIDGRTTCLGSAMVDVAVNDLATVTIILQCRATDSPQ